MKFLFIIAALCLLAGPGVVQAADLGSFELQNMNAPEHPTYKSSDVKAARLIDFYFATCPACNENASNVDAIYDEFNSTQVHILQVSIDCDDSDYQSWISRHDVKGAVLNDCNRTLPRQQGVSAYPTAAIWDCYGHQVWRKVGVWSSSDLRTVRDKLTELQFQICE